MSQNLQNFVKFQKFQLENLVDFEKCCKTHIFLQKSEPIQPKTSNILPKFCQPTLSDVVGLSAAEGRKAGPLPSGSRYTWRPRRRSERAENRPGPVRPFDSFSIRSFLSFSILRLYRLWTSGFAARTGTFFVSFFSVLLFSYACVARCGAAAILLSCFVVD